MLRKTLRYRTLLDQVFRSACRPLPFSPGSHDSQQAPRHRDRRRSFSSIPSPSQNVEKVLIVGAGAIGLRTAVEFLRRNVPVVLRAPRHPLQQSCSMGAGGLWMPFHVEDERVNRWAKETLDELIPMANDPGNDTVEIVPSILLHPTHEGATTEDMHLAYEKKAGEHTKSRALPGWTEDDRIQFQHLTVEMLAWQNIIYKLKIPPEEELKDAGYLHAWFFRPPIVDSPKMLENMLHEINASSLADVNVNTETEFSSIEEMSRDAKSLGCDALINCTGLGAAQVCDDKHVVGARGILHHYDRSNCVRRSAVMEGTHEENVNDAIVMCDDGSWGNETMPAYIIPRGKTIVVGGSYLEGDLEESIREDERKRLLLNATRLGIDTTTSNPVGEWTGFRPVRSKVRCEMARDLTDGVTVFHSYGYGGSGWTLNVGAAKECANALLGEPATSC